MTTLLSERELQILRLVAEGFSNRQIASMLDISENTVKVHVRNIFGKIQVASRTEASMYAVRNGLIADIVSSEDNYTPAHSDVRDDVGVSHASGENRSSWWIHQYWVIWVGMVIVVVAMVGVWWSMRAPYPVRPIEQVNDTQRWSTLAPLPIPASGVQLVTVTGQLYALGGELERAVWRYDASQAAWMRTRELPFTPGDVSWSDATGVWVIDSDQHMVWSWDGQVWLMHVALPAGVQPTALVRVAGALMLLDRTNGVVWVIDMRVDQTWQQYAVPTQTLVAPRLVAMDDVLYLLGDGVTVWRSLNQGRSWQEDGVLVRPWQGGHVVPVLNALMLLRDGQQSLYTLMVGEGSGQALPLEIAMQSTQTIWQTMVVIGAPDGRRIDTYQFIYQSFMPMMQ